MATVDQATAMILTAWAGGRHFGPLHDLLVYGAVVVRTLALHKGEVPFSDAQFGRMIEYARENREKLIGDAGDVRAARDLLTALERFAGARLAARARGRPC